MYRRIWEDESGMALGLAVIVVLLIGVLAAGFLALVRNDLEAAISANHGQRAFALADAGAQAGMARLRSDANPEHYDADAAENAEWAYDPSDRTSGKVLSLDDGSARVKVRYLLPATDDTATESEAHAPERVPPGTADYPNKDYFTVAAEGTFGETMRKVEVIVCVTAAGDSRSVERWSWREAYE